MCQLLSKIFQLLPKNLSFGIAIESITNVYKKSGSAFFLIFALLVSVLSLAHFLADCALTFVSKFELQKKYGLGGMSAIAASVPTLLPISFREHSKCIDKRKNFVLFLVFALPFPVVVCVAVLRRHQHLKPKSNGSHAFNFLYHPVTPIAYFESIANAEQEKWLRYLLVFAFRSFIIFRTPSYFAATNI